MNARPRGHSENQMKTITTKAGVTLDITGTDARNIPADWTKKAVLLRKQTGERFAFYALTDGRVAEVIYHPMNGTEDMFTRIGPRDFMAAAYQELLDGEPWETRTATWAGGIDRRRGRYAKCQRVA